MRPRDLFWGPRGVMGGGRGSQGVKGDVLGIPYGQWVGLRSLLMIPEAYMPVYRCPDFHCVRTYGFTRGITRGPRGPKNAKSLDITLFCTHKYYTLLFTRQLMFVAVFNSQWTPNTITNFSQPGITNGLVSSSYSKGFSSLGPTCSGSLWREEG